MPKPKEKRSLSQQFQATTFKPAYLSAGKQILVIYYYKDYRTGRLKRFRISVPKQKNKQLSIKLGHKMVDEINRKLFAGWNPYNDDKPFIVDQSFETAAKMFVDRAKKNVKLDLLRPDTLRSYQSFVRIVTMYILQKKIKNLMLSDITRSFIMNELDWLLYERNNKPRTYNNHLAYWVTFLNFCIDKGFLNKNVATTIKKKRKTDKVRQIFPPEIKTKIKMLQYENKAYYTLCMMTYYCFIRRTELTKLKVKHLHMPYYITIPADISKNRKESNITIPKELNKLLEEHIKGASLEDYIFSHENNYKPGTKKLRPNKISNDWNKFRKKYDLPMEYQFYSLKDTGITDLLRKGVPAIKVRDQARHYDLRITESYTARIKTYDEEINNIDFTF